MTSHAAHRTTDETIRLARAREMADSGRGREVRLAARLSLADIAATIGAYPSSIQRWERGARRPYGPAALRWLALIEALEEAHRAA